MKTVQQIYEEYRIMPNLQLHMLRVAAVASVICDALELKSEKENILLSCLFHDMGNIIKSNLAHFPSEFYAPHGVEYWQNVKDEYIAKYGNNEHEMSQKVAEEIGLPSAVIEIINQNRFTLLCEHAKSSDLSIKIVHYSDMRVGPYGVLSYEGRMDESGKRYKGLNTNFETERLRLVQCGKDIENEIFSMCKIKPEDVNDEVVKDIIPGLRKLVVK